MQIRKYWLKAKGYPFVTDEFRKSRAMTWLKNTHAWVGVWGAVACIIFGVSTIALQHPELFPTGEPSETFRGLPLNGAVIQSHEDLINFVEGELLLVSEASQGTGRRGVAPDEAVNSWVVNYSAIGRSVVATYIEGNQQVEIHEVNDGLLRIMNLMHLGRGAGMGWTVLGDIFSGSLILVCLTGFLLWNVFAGSRALGIGVFASGLLITLYFTAMGA